MTVTLRSYADVQQLLNDFVTAHDVPMSLAPHGEFWSILTYDEFVSGDVPNVTDPDTGQPLKILIRTNSGESNLILALRGSGPLFGVNGSIGPMPPSGPAMSEEQIAALADWIDRDCPNRPAG